MPSKIEWTDETWNPIRARNRATGGVGHYCAKVSAGCQGCYAEGMQKRLFNNPIRYAAQDRDRVDIFLDEAALLKPLAWKKPRVVFPCSMTDIFGEWVTDAMLLMIFAIMESTPRHSYKILTKRPERMQAFMRNAGPWVRKVGIDCLISKGYQPGSNWPPPNVQLGVSAEDQESADARIPLLLATPAAKRIVSLEPLLGPVDLHSMSPDFLLSHKVSLDQVIAGGESGPKARPSHPDWFRSLRDQCLAAKVPFFFKQWGEWAVVYDRDVDDPDWRRCPQTSADGGRSGRYLNLAGGFGFHGDRVVYVKRVGKLCAGRLLDGAIWDQSPRIDGAQRRRDGARA